MHHSLEWRELKNGAYKDTCSSINERLCDKWGKDLKRCCPEKCKNSTYTEEVCKNDETYGPDKKKTSGQCQYPFRAKYEECERGKKMIQRIDLFWIDWS